MIDHEPALYDEISAPRNLEPTGPPDRTYKVSIYVYIYVTFFFGINGQNFTFWFRGMKTLPLRQN